MSEQDHLLQLAHQIFAEKPPHDQPSLDPDNNPTQQNLLKIKQLMDGFNTTEDSINRLQHSNWGHLQVKNLLGQGGMGSVYRAFDPVLNRHVALKVLNQRSAQYIDAANFVQEAQRMAQIRHPHIMAVYGAGQHDGMAAFWGELLQGAHLHDYLRQQPVSQAQRLELAVQLAEAVLAIHNQQLVHADIKNTNVMVEPGRGAVLMDFGASVDLQQQEHKLFHTATPLAMAPEQFAGQPPTQASDVFALGVVLYHLFCEQYPFPGKDFADLKQHVISGKFRGFKQPPAPNRKLRMLIQQMLSNDPASRPTATAVRASLLEIQRLPLQRAQRNSFILATLFLISVAAASLFTAYKTKQSNTLILQAQRDTETVNEFMEQMLSSPATIHQGKDVLMLDVVKAAMQQINDNTSLSGHAKGRLQYAMAFAMMSLGEQEQASQLFSNITEAGAAAPFTLKNAWIQLARINTDALRFDEAKQQLTRAKKTAKFTENWQLSEANLLASYARLYQTQQQFKRSSEYALRAVQLFDELGDHRAKSHPLILLGRNHMYLSNHEEAERRYRQAHQHAVKFGGKRNLNALIAQIGMATMMSVQGKLAESRAVFDELIPLARDFLGPGHPLFFSIRFNFALLLTKSGEHEAALAQQLDILNEGDQSGGPPLGLAQLKSNVANRYAHLKRYQEAEAMYLETIAEITELTSKNHRSVFQAKVNYAGMLNDLERGSETLSLLNPITADATAVLGAEHQIVLVIYSELARAHRQTGDPGTAHKLLQKIQPIYSKKYGATDERTIAITRRMEAVSASQ